MVYVNQFLILVSTTVHIYTFPMWAATAMHGSGQPNKSQTIRPNRKQECSFPFRHNADITENRKDLTTMCGSVFIEQNRGGA